LFTGGGGGGGGGSPISNNDALIVVVVFFGGLPRGRFVGDSGDDDDNDGDAVLFLDGEGLFLDDEEGKDLTGLPLFLGVFLAGDGMVVVLCSFSFDAVCNKTYLESIKLFHYHSNISLLTTRNSLPLSMPAPDCNQHQIITTTTSTNIETPQKNNVR
jgi:hypothetical protein